MLFSVESRDPASAARTGRLRLRHGEVATPVFMPVGTLATVKTLDPEDLRQLGAGIILSNTYHLFLRPGGDTVAALGGLHRFMGWDRPILTDSGGYQVFSLAPLRKINEEGVEFQSHLDGTRHQLSPETAIATQRQLGSDIAMCLDECPPIPEEKTKVEAAVGLTTRWAARCKKAMEGSPDRLFGIVQGGLYPDLRQRSAEQLQEIGFDGYAIGGLSVGEPPEQMHEALEYTVPHLPDDRPRYLMGVGRPEDLVEGVWRGVDMFDCVMPTRNARNGTLFTGQGTLNIRNEAYSKDPGPVEEGCGCPACTRFSRAYLRHLMVSKEILGLRLNTMHNLYYYLRLMDRLREAVRQGTLSDFRKRFHEERTQTRPRQPAG